MTAAASGMKNPYIDPVVLCPRDASVVVGLHDLMFLDTNDVKPASSFTWDTDEATTQLGFGPNFIGLAGEARTSAEGADTHFPIITRMVKRVPVESSTYVIGDGLAPDSASSLLMNGTLKKTSVAGATIARSLENQASAVTTLLVEFFSRVLPPHPLFTTTTTGVLQIPLSSGVVFDANQTKLPGTAAADDMALIGTNMATVGMTLQGVDFGGTSTDEKAGFEVILPPDYVAGGALTLKVKAGMLTAVSDGTCTVDAEVFPDSGEDGVPGTDICTTAAQSINSLTLAVKSFTITPTGLVAGDRLFIRLSFAGSDVGNLAVMIPTITSLKLEYARTP